MISDKQLSYLTALSVTVAILGLGPVSTAQSAPAQPFDESTMAPTTIREMSEAYRSLSAEDVDMMMQVGAIANHDNKDEGGHCHHNNNDEGKKCPDKTIAGIGAFKA